MFFYGRQHMDMPVLADCDTIWVYAPGRRSLCVFWRETQTKGLSSRSPIRPEVDEEREIRERREGQLTKEPREGSQQRRAEESGRF